MSEPTEKHVDWERLAGAIAQTMRGGLPLPAALEALACCAEDDATGQALKKIAEGVARGQSLEEAFQALSRDQSRELQAVVTAAMLTPKPAEALEEILKVRKEYQDNLRGLRASLAYPTLCGVFVMLGFALLVVQWGGLLGLMSDMFNPGTGFGTLFYASDQDKLVAWRVFFSEGYVLMFFWVAVSWVVGLGAIITFFVLLRVILSPVSLASRPWIYRFPLLGKYYQAAAIWQASRAMTLLLKGDVRLPAALQAVADLIRWPRLSRLCRSLAHTVEAGDELGNTLARHTWLPATFVSLLQEPLPNDSLEERFSILASHYGDRIRGLSLKIETVFLAVMLLGLYPFAQTVVTWFGLLQYWVSRMSGPIAYTDDVGYFFKETMSFMVAMLVPLVAGIVLLLVSRPRGRDIFQDTAPWMNGLRLLGWICLGWSGFLILGPVGFVVLVLIPGLWVMSWPLDSFWLVLSSALKHNRPLVPALTAFLKETGLSFETARVRALASGLPLEDVLERYPVWWRDRFPIHMGALTGRWSEVIASEERDRLARREADEIFYGRFVVVVMAGFLLGFASLFVQRIVLEQLDAIFAGLSTDQIPFSLFLIQAANVGDLENPLFAVLFLAFGTLLQTFGSQFASLAMLCAVLIPLFYLAGGEALLRDLVPLVVASPRSRSQVLRAMAHCVRARKTYPEILETLIRASSFRFSFFPKLSGIIQISTGRVCRLKKALVAIRAGEHACAALVQAKLITPADGEILAAAETLGNLPETLDMLADLYRDRHALRLRNWGIYGSLALIALVAVFAALLYLLVLGFVVVLIYALL